MEEQKVIPVEIFTKFLDELYKTFGPIAEKKQGRANSFLWIKAKVKEIESQCGYDFETWKDWCDGVEEKENEQHQQQE